MISSLASCFFCLRRTMIFSLAALKPAYPSCIHDSAIIFSYSSTPLWSRYIRLGNFPTTVLR
jgi:hypothetical protein